MWRLQLPHTQGKSFLSRGSWSVSSGPLSCDRPELQTPCPPKTAPQLSLASQCGSSSLPSMWGRAHFPTMPTYAGGRNCPHHDASSVEKSSLWPTSSTPARRPSTCDAIPPGTTMSSKSFLTSPSGTWPQGCRSADLPGQQYIFPQDIAPTDLRPDIVIWGTSTIYLVELTVPFKINITDAAERKIHRYRDLAKACTNSNHMTIITLEVGSRGFLSTEGFKQLYKLLEAKATDRQNLELDVTS